ncbi:unnamed protein product [Ophioblennius macclurei]
MLKAVGQALFSSGVQNPQFTAAQNQGQDYEVRTYHSTKWVSTTVSGPDLDGATNAGFMRLFNYIQGKNETKAKVDMTAPVACHVEPETGPTVTVSFYIPQEHQENPPEPSDPTVFVEQKGEFTVYVRTFGGFAKEASKREELQKLIDSLKRDGVAYVEAPFYTAGYDSPFKLVNRRNEVWVLQKAPGK